MRKLSLYFRYLQPTLGPTQRPLRILFNILNYIICSHAFSVSGIMKNCKSSIPQITLETYVSMFFPLLRTFTLPERTVVSTCWLIHFCFMLIHWYSFLMLFLALRRVHFFSVYWDSVKCSPLLPRRATHWLLGQFKTIWLSVFRSTHVSFIFWAFWLAHPIDEF